MIQFLFFDLGSTLIDESECIEFRIQHLLQQSNCPERGILESRMKELASQNKLPYKDAAKEYGLETLKWPKQLERVYEGVPEILTELKKRYRLGIIANQSFGAEQRLKDYGIYDFFDVIISSAEVGLEKPDPAIFQLALETAGCAPEEAIMIGDRLDNDIDPAAGLGMHTIWVKQGAFAYGDVSLIKHAPEYTVDSIKEVVTALNQYTTPRCRAVIFDLFETLITEWGHEKYTKRKMCADLGVDKEQFDVFWEEKEEERYLGEIDCEGSIRYAINRLGAEVSNGTMAYVLNRRLTTKAACFEYIDPAVFRLLEELRSKGLRTAIVSNCSSEEVKVIRESELYRYFDEVVLSYEVHRKKPDRGIYEEAARRLGVEPGECIFVGDGGSNELPGAEAAGMKAIQAKWYTNRLPQARETIGAFPVAEEPLEVLEFIA